MDKALSELKIQAKKLLKALHKGEDALEPYQPLMRKKEWSEKSDWQLKDCLNLVSMRLGFNQFQHAQIVLSGKLDDPEMTDFGAFWHHPGCDALVNHWFANYQEAKQALVDLNVGALFPYKKQYVIGQSEYLKRIGIEAKFSDAERDFVQCYGSPYWDELALLVIRNRS